MNHAAADTSRFRLELTRAGNASWPMFCLFLAGFGYLAYTAWFKEDTSDLPPGLMIVIYVAPLIMLVPAVVVAVNSFSRLVAITIDEQGVTLDFATRQEQRRWEEIGGALGQHDRSGRLRLLWVFDLDGNLVCYVSDGYSGFDNFCQRVFERVEPYTMQGLPEVFTRRDRAGAIKSLLYITSVIVGIGAFGWTAWEMHDRPLRLDREGVEGTAEIIEVFIDPEDNDQRVRYQVIDSAEPRPPLTTTLKETQRDRYRVGDEAGVLYIPDEPRNSRLAGQVEAPPHAALLANLPALVILLVVLGFLIKLELSSRGRKPMRRILDGHQKLIDHTTPKKQTASPRPRS